MAEPREFYFPLQDKAADIDRVLHDLVGITDTEESLDMYVKVIKVEGQPHFWFGEGGEKQKPIDVNEWEVPVGDGNNWVRKSKFYAPFQEGTLIEDVLPADITDLTLTLSFDDYRYGDLDSPPLNSTIWRVVGVRIDKTNYSHSVTITDRITKDMFDNLFNDESNFKLEILASDYSYSSSDFKETKVVYNSEEDNYDVFFQSDSDKDNDGNNDNYKIATLSYDQYAMKIIRYFIPHWSSYVTPYLKFNFTYHINNIDFSRYVYEFGVAAADSDNLGIQYDLMGYCKATAEVLSNYWDEFYETPLTTIESVKSGIYSIGPIVDHANLDVLYIGQLKKRNDNTIEPIGGIQNIGTYDSIPSSNGPGITMKKNSCIIIERGGLNLQDSGITMHNQAAINMDGNEIMHYSLNGKDAWDGTFAGTNQHATETPYLHLHGMSKIIMDNKSMIMMGAGAFLDMSGEAYCTIHGLSKIDISGAPWIHIHGNNNKDSSSGETLKYGLSIRQPSIFIDDGTKLSFSGNEYGDPFVFMKGCSGIVFNNNHGVEQGDKYMPDPATENLGPLFMINEDSFYFDGFGTSGAIGNKTILKFDVQPLDLSKENLNQYTDPVWESMQEELILNGQCEFTNARISKLYEMLGRAELPYYYIPIQYKSSEYIQQVGEALEDYLQTISEKPNTFKKQYYIKASKYDEAMTLASEITNPIFSTTNYGFCLDGDFSGSTIVEDKFIEKGLNINDYVFTIAYEIYFDTSWFPDDFIEYYYNLYGTRTLETARVVYRQPYKKQIDNFLKYYYNQKLSDYADVSTDGIMMTMEWSNYLDLDAKYSEYNANKTSFSWYITTDYSTYLAVKDTFERVAVAYYRIAFPCFQERFYAGNGIVILGGDKGSKTWFKIGGEPGTFTDVCITDNAKVLIQGNTEFNLSGNTKFMMKNTGITLKDNSVNSDYTFTVNELQSAINGSGASSASQVSYDNTTSGLTATNVKDALDELAAKTQALGGGIRFMLITKAAYDELNPPDPTIIYFVQDGDALTPYYRGGVVNSSAGMFSRGARSITAVPVNFTTEG